MSNKSVTYRELIKEIRTLNDDVTRKLEHLENSLNAKVSVEDFAEYKAKTDKLWDEHNKMIGYVIGGGITGGVVAQGLTKLVTEVMAKF
jgi:hypothetical protein